MDPGTFPNAQTADLRPAVGRPDDGARTGTARSFARRLVGAAVVLGAGIVAAVRIVRLGVAGVPATGADVALVAACAGIASLGILLIAADRRAGARAAALRSRRGGHAHAAEAILASRAATATLLIRKARRDAATPRTPRTGTST